ncbi:hypothetical protein ABEB36_004697 [Hypothenemus hampei]|uniref:Ubiquitin thioesterase OTU n=1 Tax=Hypothenemus hampei TaxID=57062 RepID=A0ABD1F6T1_HYPHA
MSNLLLRVKTKNGQHVVKNLTQDHKIHDLKETLAELSNIPVNRLQVLLGFPPKVLDISNDNLELAQSGLSTGDTLILQEISTPLLENTTPTGANDASKCVENNQTDDFPGILMKQIVPADNSCLFSSFHFVLNGKLDESGEAGKFLRQLVAETIRNEKHNYDEAILGKPVEEYCAWIQNDTSWGGAIELAILSNYYGIEIAVVDTINAIINRFGEDQNYSFRVFLMFDGIHYDPLYLEPFTGGKIQTIFQSSDIRILEEAKILAQEAKSSRQFTDVNKFSLKCMDCNIMLKGQIEARDHAMSTGHMNFGEI